MLSHRIADHRLSSICPHLPPLFQQGGLPKPGNRRLNQGGQVKRLLEKEGGKEKQCISIWIKNMRREGRQCRESGEREEDEQEQERPQEDRQCRERAAREREKKREGGGRSSPPQNDEPQTLGGTIRGNINSTDCELRDPDPS